MLILGLSFLSDCGAVLIRDGHLLEAVNEERFTRVKHDRGIPRRCIEYIFERHALSWADIDVVATHGALDDDEAHRAAFAAKEAEVRAARLEPDLEAQQLMHLAKRFEHELRVRSVRTPDYLRQVRDLRADAVAFRHHHCHAATAYFMHAWDASRPTYILTADGWGEDGSSTFWKGNGTELEPLGQSPTFSSLGYF